MLGSASPLNPSVRMADEILGPADLARRVPLDRQARILAIHAVAVVLDADRLLAAELDRDRDAARVRVERVLDQLLDDGRRTLDDFAGRDLIGEMKREAIYAAHDARYNHPIFRKISSIPPETLNMTTSNHPETGRAKAPRLRRSTFMPYMPVMKVSGMKIVAMTVRTFITPFSWFDTVDRCASSRLAIRS